MDAQRAYDRQVASTSRFPQYMKPVMMQQYPPARRQNIPHTYSPNCSALLHESQTDHISHWMNGPYAAGYANSSISSAAPSVMSHISMQDDFVSVLSVQTTLNASTAPCPQNPTKLRPQSQFSSSASTPPCTENVYPATIQEGRNVAYSINNFCSNDYLEVLSPGARADEGKSGKKLTPAPQPCLGKIFVEVRSVSIGEPDLGTFLESSSFMPRKVDAYSVLIPTKKKPDVELMDLSGTKCTCAFIPGDREHTATEYTDDVEMGSLHCIDDSRHSVSNEWKETVATCLIDDRPDFDLLVCTSPWRVRSHSLHQHPCEANAVQCFP